MSEKKKFDEQVAPLTISQANVFRLLALNPNIKRIRGRSIEGIGSSVLVCFLGHTGECGKIAYEVLGRRIEQDRSTVEILIEKMDVLRAWEVSLIMQLLGTHGKTKDEDIIVPALVVRLNDISIPAFPWAAFNALVDFNFQKTTQQVLDGLALFASGWTTERTNPVSRDDGIGKMFSRFVGTEYESAVVTFLLLILRNAIYERKENKQDFCLRALKEFVGGKSTEQIVNLFKALFQEKATVMGRSTSYAKFMTSFAPIEDYRFVASEMLVEYADRVMLKGQIVKEFLPNLLPFMNLGCQKSRRFFVDYVRSQFKDYCTNYDAYSLLYSARSEYDRYDNDQDLFEIVLDVFQECIKQNKIPHDSAMLLSGYSQTDFAGRARDALVKAPLTYVTETAIEIFDNPHTDDHEFEWCLKRELIPTNRSCSKRVRTLEKLQGKENWFKGEKGNQLVDKLLMHFTLESKNISNDDERAKRDRKEQRLLCELLARFVGTEHEDRVADALASARTRLSDGWFEAMAKFKGNEPTLKTLLQKLSFIHAEENNKRIVAALSERIDELNQLEIK